MLWATLRQMRSTDPEKRLAAAQKLGAGRDPQGVGALVAAINDGDINVRRAVVIALGQCGGEEAIPPLVKAAGDPLTFVQWEAAAALVMIGPMAVRHLVPGLRAPEPAVRQMSEALLRQIAANPTLPPVVGATIANVLAEAGLQAAAPPPSDPVVEDAQPEDSKDEEEDDGGDDSQDDDGDDDSDDDDADSDDADGDDDPDEDEDEDADGSAHEEHSIGALTRALAGGDALKAIQAARALCESGSPGAWEALVATGGNPDKRVGKFATMALAKLCRFGDVQAMRTAVALQVIERLEDLPGEHAEQVFRRALAHADSHVRDAARQVLDDRGIAPADDEEKRLRAMSAADWAELRKLGTGGVADVLIAQLRSTDRYERQDGAEKLGELNDGRGVEPLIAALGDPEERVRGAAAVSLAKLKDGRAVPPLIHTLRDRDEWVRCRVADALAEFGDGRAVPALIDALSALGKTVRRSAARALAKLGGAAVIAPLGEALRDADVEVRRIAAVALADAEGELAQRFLAAATSDADDEVRSAAALGLGKAGGGESGSVAEAALLAALRSPGRAARKAAAEALQARGWEPADDEQRAFLLVASENPLGAEPLADAAVDALALALLDGGHYYLSQTAAECFGRILDPRAVAPLSRSLRESTDMTVRGAAATALGRIRDRAAVPALVEALRTESESWVRPFIAMALGKIGGPAAAAALRNVPQLSGGAAPEWASAALALLDAAADPDRLVAALTDDDRNVQLRAAILLARRGDPRGADWLDRATHGDDAMIRQKAIDALQAIGGAGSTQRLIDRVRGPGFDGPNEAVEALVKIGETAVRPMVAALADMTHNPRWAMLTGLARLGPPAMVALCAALPGAAKDLKKIACEVLGRMYDRDDVTHKPIEPLVALLADEDKEVRHSAAHGLNLLKWKPANVQEQELLARAKQW